MADIAKTIMVLGNLGYIGPVVVRALRDFYPQAKLIGYDTAYFQGCLTDPYTHAEHGLDQQHYGDIRHLSPGMFRGVDAVVALAAISNDPMGNAYEKSTMEINADAIVALAGRAEKEGVRHFVFASSCSVYGAGGDTAKTEASELNPLTAYARSKIACEEGLAPLAGPDFTVTCLRFATACGYSPRLRLDLVLNDFVASALATRRIAILSDGTPWRPLIDVNDMGRAIAWAIARDPKAGGNFLAVNAGSDAWNCTIHELALAVAAQLGGIEVTVNAQAAPDKRSYRVDFSLFRSLAPQHQPRKTFDHTIGELAENLKRIGFSDPDFRKSHLIRLTTLHRLRETGRLDENLYWTKRQAI